MNLFINHYIDPDPLRNEELQTCFENNKANNFTIYILEGRPTFNDFFKKINEVTGDHSINIIANSDIYFPEMNYEMFKNLTFDICYALTRWNVSADGKEEFHNNSGSQDTWIFRGKVKEVNADFTQGVAGCDNKLAYLLEKAGYKVINPSRTIKTYHLHNSEVRYYDKKIVNGDIYRLPRPRKNVPISAL